MYNPMDLTGKRILVTGASSGIGRACAVVLSKLGAGLVLVGRNEARLHETERMLEGSDHQIQPFDLEQVEQIKNLTVLTNAREHKFSGIVHSAGVCPIFPIAGTTQTMMEMAMRVNFNSFVEITRCFTKKMYFSDLGGSLVAISAVASLVGWSGGTAYCSTKGAINSFVRVAAIELAPKQIRVNGVCPGYIDTPMLNGVGEHIKPVKKNQNDFGKEQPIGLGDPVDVAHAVGFLLSDASKFITGTNLVVDGGCLAQ
jgi:NAD(P)-dependent dehydrogenase (short-subunit alcohol dehydrogenase family)